MSDSFVKDATTGAVINKDVNAFLLHKRRRDLMLQEKQKYQAAQQTVEERVRALEQKVIEITEQLEKLMGK